MSYARTMDLAMATSVSLRVLGAEGSERQEWLDLLDSWEKREVFAHPDYLRLFKGTSDKPICIIYTCPEGRVIYPLILRDLRAPGLWRMDGCPLYDAIAPPYGYGGPFIDGKGPRSVLLKSFFREYEHWALVNHVISEYNTLSPKEDSDWHYPGQVVVKAPTVIRSLRDSEEIIWRDYRGSVRRSIRSAERAGVVVEVDTTGERVNDFLAVYNETMLRRQASISYHLTRKFLEQLNSTLRGYYVYFHALHGGRVVSSELVLVSADSTFFFRGGTRFDSMPLRPNHLLKHHLILWSLRQGKKYYVLGGGNCSEDSLYRYKLTFAPKGSRNLEVGMWIIDPKRYWDLVEARRTHERDQGVAWVPKIGYFPEYRAPSIDSAQVA